MSTCSQAPHSTFTKSPAPGSSIRAVVPEGDVWGSVAKRRGRAYLVVLTAGCGLPWNIGWRRLSRIGKFQQTGCNQLHPIGPIVKQAPHLRDDTVNCSCLCTRNLVEYRFGALFEMPGLIRLGVLPRYSCERSPIAFVSDQHQHTVIAASRCRGRPPISDQRGSGAGARGKLNDLGHPANAGLIGAAQLVPAPIINQSVGRQTSKLVGGNMARPRAADDFPAIRARMEELRRERDQVLAEGNPQPAIGPRPYFVGRSPAVAGKPGGLLPTILRALAKAS